MLTMASQIEIYEEMSALSTRMVEAAQTGEWDTLFDLEQSVSRLRVILMADLDPNAGLTKAELSRKAALIQRILDNDAEIRRYTEPRMEHVRKFLGGTTQRKKLEHAYGAGLVPGQSGF
jgi:flagellar protein FliT